MNFTQDNKSVLFVSLENQKFPLGLVMFFPLNMNGLNNDFGHLQKSAFIRVLQHCAFRYCSTNVLNQTIKICPKNTN